VSAEGTPAASEAGGETITRGYTGQITQVTSNGTQSVLVSGLLAYSVGVGPVGIELGAGELFFDIGGGAVGAGLEPMPEENTVNRVNIETGEVTQGAARGPYEVENNPDGIDVNPSRYQITTGPDGRLLVCDAGGNTIYAVDTTRGKFEVVGVIPALGQLPGGEGFTGEDAARQPVPTSVAVSGDGATVIGLLSEGWPEGAPSVLNLGSGGSLRAVASGLEALVGLTIGPDGHLYGSQLWSQGGQGPGSVVRIYGDGTIELVVENVMMPHGTAFDVAGNIYIAINSLMSAPGAPAGQVIRVDGIATVG
jgi:sugar lactone lactonase YvrE